MKHSRLIVFLVSLLVIAGTANAFVLSNVDGTWSNWVGGGASVVTPSGLANLGYGNQLQDQIRWGTLWSLGGTGQKSGLGFTGAAGGGTTVSFGLGEAFQIGELEHFNWPIDIGSNVTDVDLTLQTVFSDPAGLDEPFSFAINVNETTNGNPTSPTPVDDIISFPGSLPSIPFTSGTGQYTLEILGFGASADDIVDEFQSPESAANQTFLWGRITGTEGPAVPVPGAIVLGSIGMTVVGLLRRRRAL